MASRKPLVLGIDHLPQQLLDSDVLFVGGDADVTGVLTAANLSGSNSGTNTGDQFMSVTAVRVLGRGDSGGGAAQEIVLGSGLSMTGTTLSVTGGGGSGTVTSVDLTAPVAGLTATGGPVTTSGSITLALADDLAALEALSGTNTLYYRSAADTWSAVTVGSGLSFSGGTLAATGTGAGDLLAENNLSDLEDTADARTNLGLGPTDTASFRTVQAGREVTISNTFNNDATVLALRQASPTAGRVRIVLETNDREGGINLINADGSIDITAVGGLSVNGTPVGGGVSDGDKGDITVSSSGSVWSIDDGAVTYAKLQNVSAAARVLGRKSSGAGDAEEVTLSELLDWIGSAARGDVLVRGASVWTRLAKGTGGKVLTSDGTDLGYQEPGGDLATATDGATVTFDMAAGRFQKVTLGGNRAIAVSNAADGMRGTFCLIQDGTGSRTVSSWFGGNVTTWHGTGDPTTAPTLSTGAGKRDYVSFIRHSSTSYDCFFSKGS